MNKWIVDIKDDRDYNTEDDCEDGSFEISVVMSTNKHGIKSYGWFNNKDKFLIGQSGGSSNDFVCEFVFEGLIELANKLADKLNHG